MLSSRDGHNDRVSTIQDDALLWDMLMDGLLNGSDGISTSEAMDSLPTSGMGLPRACGGHHVQAISSWLIPGRDCWDTMVPARPHSRSAAKGGAP